MRKLMFLMTLLLFVGAVSAVQIGNCVELKDNFSCTGYNELTADINGSCLTSPLCSGGFSGTLDGKDNTIYDISFMLSVPVGLFQSLDGAIIQNLGIVNSTFLSWTEDAGAMAGIATDSKISNSYSASNTIQHTASAKRSGGLIGVGSNITFNLTYSKSNLIGWHLSGVSGYYGGFVGQSSSDTLIVNSYSVYNDLNRTAGSKGGFMGRSMSLSNRFVDSYSAFNTFGGSGVGFTGLGSTTIIDSYSDKTNGVPSGTGFSCYADSDCGGLDFNISEYDLSELSSDGWGSPPWCESSENYPLSIGLGGQSEVCDFCDGGVCSAAQGPGGDDEVIPEFSDTGKVIISVIALIVVAIVASMLMKKKEHQ